LVKEDWNGRLRSKTNQTAGSWELGP
jgi:hypothetical protein